MTSLGTFRCGDVILASFPYITDPAQAKVRPAVVIQNDVGNRFSPNLIVALISSQMPRQRYPTNLVVLHGSPEAAGTGLDRDSVVQVEHIVTIAKAAVIRRLGRFNDPAMQAVDQRIKASLGLA